MTLRPFNRSRGDCCHGLESCQARRWSHATGWSPNAAITRRILSAFLSLAAFVASCPNSYGQIDAEPVMRLEADGPTSYVSSLAFSPDGQTLYAGSWDKTVYVWKWDRASRSFRIDPQSTL